MTYKEIKDKYTKFIYDKYEIIDEPNTLKIKYYFEIPGLSKFNPTLEIPKRCIKNEDIDNNILNEMIFDIGMVELISYWKICMPKEIIINAGYLDEYSKSFYKKLYYNKVIFNTPRVRSLIIYAVTPVAVDNHGRRIMRAGIRCRTSKISIMIRRFRRRLRKRLYTRQWPR